MLAHSIIIIEGLESHVDLHGQGRKRHLAHACQHGSNQSI